MNIKIILFIHKAAIMNICISDLQKAEQFTNMFQHIKAFTECVNVTFETTHLFIQSMDSSKVSIFEFNIQSEWFSKYELIDHKSLTIGLSSSLLFRILKARSKGQSIHLSCKDEDPDILYISLMGKTDKNEFDKHFEMSLTTVEDELLAIPEMDYDVEMSICSETFAEIINQLKMFGDNLEFNCTDEKVLLYSSNTEQGKMVVEIKIDDLTSYAIGDNINMLFSLKLLQQICLYSKMSSEVLIYLSADSPIRFEYIIDKKVSENENEEILANLIFFLAPRIPDM